MRSYRGCHTYASYTNTGGGGFFPKTVELAPNHPVVTKAKKGDVLRVMRNVGGGGGRVLNVRDFTMRVAHKHD